MPGTPREPRESSREQDVALMRRLEIIYAGGGVTPTPGDAAAVVAAAGLELIGADAGFVATLSEDGAAIEVSRVTPHSATPVHLAFPVDAPYPLAAVFRRKTELFIESNDQLACDHPGLVRMEETDHACATIPLRDADGRLLGALNLGFEDPRAFDDPERRAIQALARRCAAALEQAQSRRGEPR